MPETITPIPRQAFNRAEFHSVEFVFDDGALGGLMAHVSFGRMVGGDFIRGQDVSLGLNKAQVMANLTTAEKSALASIKSKLMQAAIGQL